MRRSKERIYRAPDGSLFRVDEDGRVSKIKEGEANPYIVSLEYNVSADGRLYVIENDGNIRVIGHAERVELDRNGNYTTEINSRHRNAPNRSGRGNNDNFIWTVAAIAVILIGGILSFVFFKSSHSDRPVEARSKGSYTLPQKKENVAADASAEKDANDGKRYFPRTIRYYGVDYQSYPDEETITIEFYPDGACYMIMNFLEEDCRCEGTYYLKGNKVYMTSGCTYDKRVSATLHRDGSFELYGITLYP